MTAARRHLVDLALAVLALASLVVVFATTDFVSTSERNSRERMLLGAWRRDDIEALKLDLGDTSIALKRVESDAAGTRQWRLTEPVQEPAEPQRVRSWLEALGRVSWQRRVEALPSAKSGVDEPHAAFQVQMGSLRYSITVGAQVPGAKARYVTVSGREIPNPGSYVVADERLTPLLTTLSEFRQKALVQSALSEFQRVELSSSPASWVITRAEWGGWRLDDLHHGWRVSRVALDRLKLGLSRLQLERFLEPALAQRVQKEGPSARLSLIPTQGVPQVLQLGGRCPNQAQQLIVASRDKPYPVQGCLPTQALDTLGVAAATLADPSLFWARHDEVAELRVSEGERSLVVTRNASGFLMRKPRRTDVALELGNAHLEALVTMRGELLPEADPSRLGLAPPLGTVTLRLAGNSDDKTETISYSKADERGLVYVKRSQDAAVLRLSETAARLLRPAVSPLRDTRVASFDPDEVAQLEIVEGDLKQGFTRGKAGTLTLTTPGGLREDHALIERTVKSLSELTALRWVSDQNDGPFGLDSPSARIQVELSRHQKPHRLELTLGGRTQGGFYAQLAGDPGVFAIPRKTVETLTTLVVARPSFLVDPEGVREITLATESGTTRLKRVGDDFVLSEPAGAGPEAAQPLVELLDTLRPEAAIALGPAPAEYGLNRPVLRVRLVLEGEPEPVTWTVGAAEVWRDLAVHYARVDGIDASFVIARSRLRALLDAL